PPAGRARCRQARLQQMCRIAPGLRLLAKYLAACSCRTLLDRGFPGEATFLLRSRTCFVPGWERPCASCQETFLFSMHWRKLGLIFPQESAIVSKARSLRNSGFRYCFLPEFFGDEPLSSTEDWFF